MPRSCTRLCPTVTRPPGVSNGWIVDPRTRWVQNWIRLLVVCLLYSTVMIPFQVGFDIEATGALLGIDTAVDVFFWLDIVLNFRLGFLSADIPFATIDDRRLIMTWKPIALRYLRGWFWVDFAAVFPITAIVTALATSSESTPSSRLARLLRLTRLPRLLRLFKFMRVTSFLSFDPNVYRLVRLIFSLFIVVHLVACSLHLTHLLEEIAATPPDITAIGADAQQYTTTWVTNAIDVGQMQDTLGDRYVTSLYWSIMTMSTVGYGDVQMQTAAERLFACFAMLLGAVSFAYMLGNVQYLMSHLDTRAAMMRTRADAITAFMRHRNITPELSLRVSNFFWFLWSRQAVFDEATILGELPAHLRREVALEMHSAIISRVPFFVGASDSFVAEVVTRMKPVQAAEGDLLVRAGEVATEMFILETGCVEILVGDARSPASSPTGRRSSSDTSRSFKNSPSSPTTSTRASRAAAFGAAMDSAYEHVVTTIGPGQFFGEIALLTRERRTASCRAATFCELWTLLRSDVDAVLKDYPEVAERMQAMAQERLSATMQEAQQARRNSMRAQRQLARRASQPGAGEDGPDPRKGTCTGANANIEQEGSGDESVSSSNAGTTADDSAALEQMEQLVVMQRAMDNIAERQDEAAEDRRRSLNRQSTCGCNTMDLSEQSANQLEDAGDPPPAQPRVEALASSGGRRPSILLRAAQCAASASRSVLAVSAAPTEGLSAWEAGQRARSVSPAARPETNPTSASTVDPTNPWTTSNAVLEEPASGELGLAPRDAPLLADLPSKLPVIGGKCDLFRARRFSSPSSLPSHRRPLSTGIASTEIALEAMEPSKLVQLDALLTELAPMVRSAMASQLQSRT